jgi:hypothetical protein
MRKPTPLQAIRKRCVWCCGGSTKDVAFCSARGCVLHPWRFGKVPVGATMSALRTIRQKCLNDCGEPSAAVQACDLVECPLHLFRLGKSPNVTEETRCKRRDAAMRNSLFLSQNARTTHENPTPDRNRDVQVTPETRV